MAGVDVCVERLGPLLGVEEVSAMCTGNIYGDVFRLESHWHGVNGGVPLGASQGSSPQGWKRSGML